MSRALGRIRRATGDDILVRTGRHMTATPYAIGIHGQVRDLVQQARDVLSRDRELDLGALDRTFTVTFQDTLAAAGGPPLLAAVLTEAPHVRLRFLAEPTGESTALLRGEIDLQASSEQPASPEIQHHTVGHDRLVIVVGADHELAAEPVTLERYAACGPHVTVSRRGRLSDPVDATLAERGLNRRVVATAPTGAVALELVRHSGVVAAVPELLSRPLTHGGDVQVLPFPIASPGIPIVLAWHRRFGNDRAHAWLRRHARTTLEHLLEQQPPLD